jgi:HEPN domain-containing protein
MALRDRDAADVMRSGRFYDVAAYHLHQAIEKMLKALLLNESLEPLRTHDLAKLHRILAHSLHEQDQQDEKISSVLRRVSLFFHVMARYPMVDETTAPEDWITEEDVALAASAWEAVSEMAARIFGVSDIHEARRFVTAMKDMGDGEFRP